eukprot:Tamp_07296.p1 GENE.Tamp_07296~~Tamp_07296.p1  ORF type:complete len:564 (-),score=102.91 Tamp_07296:839-2497(-)
MKGARRKTQEPRDAAECESGPDPLSPMRERSFLSADKKALRGVAHKVSKANLFLQTTQKGRELAGQPQDEEGQHGALGDLVRRREMPRKLADKLKASAWGQSMPTLEHLGLIDKETVQNIIRSFGDEDEDEIRRRASRSLSPIRAATAHAKDDLRSGERFVQTEHLFSDASPEESGRAEAVQRRRRHRNPWKATSPFLSPLHTSGTRDECLQHDFPELRPHTSEPLPPDSDQGESSPAPALVLHRHKSEPLPPARDGSKSQKKHMRARAESQLSPVSPLNTRGMLRHGVYPAAGQSTNALPSSADKLPKLASHSPGELERPEDAAERRPWASGPSMRGRNLLQILKKTNDTQVARSVMDLAHADERSAEREKVFCEMIDKHHLQIQKFSSTGISGSSEPIVLFERHVEELELELLTNRAEQADAIKVMIYETLGKKKGILIPTAQLRNVDRKITQLFSGLDVNGDGVLSVDELKPMAKKMAHATSQLDVERMFHKMDANGNGEISRDEFAAFFGEAAKAQTIYLQSQDPALVRKWYDMLICAKADNGKNTHG